MVMAVGKEVFSQILRSAEGVRRARGLTTKSLGWFQKKVKQATKGEKVSIKSVLSRRELMVAKLLGGRMYHFRYDPKWKEKLPYWDTFQLVIPIDSYGDGFDGLNLHYLPLKLRAKLFDALSSVLTDNGLNEKARFKLTYNLLSGAKKFKLFRPTYKRYLYSKVKSRFLLIPPEEWQIALFLPTQKFVKSQANQIWKDSKKIGRGR